MRHLCKADLRVTEDGVVEEDAEEHEAQGDNLLPGDRLDAHKLFGWGSCIASRRCHNVRCCGPQCRSPRLAAQGPVGLLQQWRPGLHIEYL